MVSGETAQERTQATKLYAEMTQFIPADGTPKPSRDIPLLEPQAPPPTSQFDAVAKGAVGATFRGLREILQMLQVDPSGVADDGLSDLVSERCHELGLNEPRVRAYPLADAASRMMAGFPLAFESLPFDSQMRYFK